MSFLPKVISSDPSRVNSLLMETITLLCRNGLSFNKQLKIEGVIGVTIDDSEITLIHINECLYPTPAADSPVPSNKNKCISSPQPSLHCRESNKIGESVFNEATDSFSMDAPTDASCNLKSNIHNKEFIIESPPFLFNSQSPSDEDEKPRSELLIRDGGRFSIIDSRQSEEPTNRMLCILPHSSGPLEKQTNLNKPPEKKRIKCETIDITDEEDCDNVSEFDIPSRVNSNNFIKDESFIQRNSLNDPRTFADREGGFNDSFACKMMSSDELLNSMNIDEHNLVSDYQNSSHARLRDEITWPGPSRLNQSAVDMEFEINYQLAPRKRMVGSVDNRPYACPVEGCDRRFFHRNNVYRHRKQKHPLEVLFKT